MVTIRICSLLVEAQTMQSVLEGSGIKSFLPDESTVQTDWMLSNAIGGIRIQVSEDDAQRAETLLNESFPR